MNSHTCPPLEEMPRFPQEKTCFCAGITSTETNEMTGTSKFIIHDLIMLLCLICGYFACHKAQKLHLQRTPFVCMGLEWQYEII